MNFLQVLAVIVATLTVLLLFVMVIIAAAKRLTLNITTRELSFDEQAIVKKWFKQYHDDVQQGTSKNRDWYVMQAAIEAAEKKFPSTKDKSS